MEKLAVINERADHTIVLKQSGVANTYPLHTHEFFEFFFVTNGCARHLVNKAVQVIERGSLVLIRPEDEHCYDYYDAQDFAFYNMGFTIETFRSISAAYKKYPDEMLSLSIPRHVKLKEGELHFLQELMDSIDSEQDAALRDIIITHTIDYVIFQMLTKKDFSGHKLLPDWLLTVLDEMEKPQNFIEGLPRLLELCNYSQEHINREFKKYLGITPTKFVNERRLRYAHRLLDETDQDILHICESCGFNNLSHFYTQFKKFSGCTPKSIRKDN